ncbi:MAG TPA: type II toxin-antitoxin system RelE/ParE family toxin [Rhizomicrobium sp.]|jgi:proteic killer suppression protein|nr:type II toxin-antitoxin system RelE/ParE family toxin [Rhizomicrobium sp.]
MRVVSIRHKAPQRLWSRNDPRGLPPDQVKRVQLALAALAAARNIRMLPSVPGWRLHELKGARAGAWSMSISGNWRLTFRLEKESIHDIDLEDYH